MSPSPSTHARAGPGHAGASQHQPAHEGGQAEFSFIKFRPGGRLGDLWDCALSPGGSCPGGLRGPSPANAPARPEAGQRWRGAAGHKEARPLRQNGLRVQEGASPQPGSKAEETGISMSQWGRGAVTRRTGQISTRNFVDFPAQGQAQKCKPGQ